MWFECGFVRVVRCSGTPSCTRFWCRDVAMYFTHTTVEPQIHEQLAPGELQSTCRDGSILQFNFQRVWTTRSLLTLLPYSVAKLVVKFWRLV